jgi:hypothetical protein
MAKTSTYQYSITYRDPKDNEKDKLVKDITSVQAQDERHAERIAMTQVPAEYNDKLAYIEVTVRPFIEPARQEKPVVATPRSSTYGSTPRASYNGKASYSLVERRSSHNSATSQVDVAISTPTPLGVATFDVERCASGIAVHPTRQTMESFDYEVLKKAAEWVFNNSRH